MAASLLAAGVVLPVMPFSALVNWPPIQSHEAVTGEPITSQPPRSGLVGSSVAMAPSSADTAKASCR